MVFCYSSTNGLKTKTLPSGTTSKGFRPPRIPRQRPKLFRVMAKSTAYSGKRPAFSPQIQKTPTKPLLELVSSTEHEQVAFNHSRRVLWTAHLSRRVWESTAPAARPRTWPTKAHTPGSGAQPGMQTALPATAPLLRDPASQASPRSPLSGEIKTLFVSIICCFIPNGLRLCSKAVFLTAGAKDD